MLAITLDARGRYVVRDERLVYGCYRTIAMALRRRAQIQWSRRPPKKVSLS